MLHALTAAEGVLVDLDPRPYQRERASEARRVIGGACASLEFVRLSDLEASLPEHLDRIEGALRGAHDAIATQFFHAATAIRWSA